MRKDKKFIYRTHLKWSGAKKGVLSAAGRPPVEIAAPPEFKGHEGKWTPEELFVASVNCCIMTTFLYYAEKERLGFNSFESAAEGVMERREGRFVFFTIEVTPRISVVSGEDIEKARSLLELAGKNCLISNSIKSKVVITPLIGVAGERDK